MVETAVSTAEQEGWTRSLIEGAIADNPGVPRPVAFLQLYARLDPQTSPAPPADMPLDPQVAWSDKVAHALRSVDETFNAGDLRPGHLKMPAYFNGFLGD